MQAQVRLLPVFLSILSVLIVHRTGAGLRESAAAAMQAGPNSSAPGVQSGEVSLRRRCSLEWLAKQAIVPKWQVGQQDLLSSGEALVRKMHEAMQPQTNPRG